MQAAASGMAQHGIHIRETLEGMVHYLCELRRVSQVESVIDETLVWNLPTCQKLVSLVRGFEIDNNQHRSRCVQPLDHLLGDGAHRTGDQNNFASEIDLNHGFRSQPWPGITLFRASQMRQPRCFPLPTLS